MGCERHCTHASPSLSQWGEIYRPILITNDTPVLDELLRKAVLRAICLHYNFTEVPKPKKGSAAYRAWQKVTSQEHVDAAKAWTHGGCYEYIERYEKQEEHESSAAEFSC